MTTAFAVSGESFNSMEDSIERALLKTRSTRSDVLNRNLVVGGGVGLCFNSKPTGTRSGFPGYSFEI